MSKLDYYDYKRTAGALALLLLMLISLGIGLAVGYDLGKRAADRYYAEHPVTLIQPIKLRAPEPVASLEEHDIRPQPHGPVIIFNLEHDGLCKWGYVDKAREGHLYDAPCEPVASLEEPK